ncbi:MAG: DUF5312 domain-containing protein [Spirochaetota bacterium]|jgi:hypothetical protein|nr:DUF5312 domain-containing protein [Spirochaetota bacterium]
MADDKGARQKNKGVFDDSFDLLALGLSKEEKERLAKKFNATPMHIAGSDTKNEPGKEVSNFESSPKKVGFFGYIIRVIYMVFTGTSLADYEKTQKLKKIKNELKQIRPPIMNFSTGQICVAFAEQVHDLYRHVWPLRPIFDEIFDDKYEEHSFNFFVFLLVRRISSLDDSYIARFSEAGLREYVEQDSDEVARSRIEELSEAFLRAINEEARREANNFYADMVSFHEILHFNFTNFLRFFSTKYSVELKENAFHDFRPEGTINEFRVLESLILSVNMEYLHDVIALASDYFLLYLQETKDENTASQTKEYLAWVTQNNSHGLRHALAVIVANRQLTLLIRYIMHSNDYEPKIFPHTANIFDDFTKVFKPILKQRTDKVLSRRIQTELSSKITELFGNFEPLPDYFYTLEENVLLEKMNLSSFIYTAAFYVSVRFYTEKYSVYIKRLVNKLIVDGSYKDSLVRRTLSDEFYHSDEITEKLMKFTEFVHRRKEKGSLFLSSLEKFRGDFASRKALNTRIAAINEGLHTVLLDIRQSADNLQNAMGRIARDIDSRKPKVVDNLQKINAGNNRFLGELKKCAHDYALFWEIIAKVFKVV